MSLVKINGLSCFPELLPEKIYLAHNFRKPKIGDFVVFNYNGKILVKKLLDFNENKLILSCLRCDEKFYINHKDIFGIILKTSSIN